MADGLILALFFFFILFDDNNGTEIKHFTFKQIRKWLYQLPCVPVEFNCSQTVFVYFMTNYDSLKPR